jgi:DnaJ-class molecular chaperone
MRMSAAYARLAVSAAKRENDQKDLDDSARYFLHIFNGMVANSKKTDYECPICSGRGRVPGRLPGRTRLCPECHGTGRTTPIRREALLKRMKTRARA